MNDESTTTGDRFAAGSLIELSLPLFACRAHELRARVAQVDRSELGKPVPHIVIARSVGYLLYLPKQVLRERHPRLCGPKLHRPVKLLGHIADLHRLRHAQNMKASAAPVKANC